MDRAKVLSVVTARLLKNKFFASYCIEIWNCAWRLVIWHVHTKQNGIVKILSSASRIKFTAMSKTKIPGEYYTLLAACQWASAREISFPTGGSAISGQYYLTHRVDFNHTAPASHQPINIWSLVQHQCRGLQQRWLLLCFLQYCIS